MQLYGEVVNSEGVKICHQENTFSFKLFTFSFLPKAGGYTVMRLYGEVVNSEG